jgi:hypothetical protein
VQVGFADKTRTVRMSWYNSVVLSFSSGEFDGESPPRAFEPVRNINAWLKKEGYGRLTDLSKGTLASNAVLFGVCSNNLDIEGFCECVEEQTWEWPEDVQVLFWDDNSTKFTVIEFRPVKKKREQGSRTTNAKTKKRRTNAR